MKNIKHVGEGIRISDNFRLGDFCGLQSVLIHGFPQGYENRIQIFGNASNPSPEEIENLNCSI